MTVYLDDDKLNEKLFSRWLEKRYTFGQAMTKIGNGIVNAGKKVGNAAVGTLKVGAGTAAVGTVAAAGYGVSQLTN